MFTAEVIGEAEVREAWGHALDDIAQGMNAGVKAGVEEAAKEARSTHRYKDRTGALTGSIRGFLTRSARGVDGGEAAGTLEAGAKHASLVEEGTAPHVIEASRADYLRWEDASGVHFAKRVSHPGAPSQPFMGPAVQKAERVAVLEIELAVERAARRFE